ncbi:MAG TPA: hypothetical protein VGL24_01065 [Chthoniobacterales bacterium]
MSSADSLTVPPQPPPPRPDDHWKFFRDVLVFELKMLLDNVRDFALMPVSLIAALIDLLFKGERQGAFFYQVLRWGAHSEEVINVYSALPPHERPSVNPSYTVDAVIARLEGVLVRECEKGGTAATIKSAMDRAINQIQTETSGPRDRAKEVVARAAEKLRGGLNTAPPPKRGEQD